MTNKKVQYGWCYLDDDIAYGPHDSREACIEEAISLVKECEAASNLIDIAEVVWADPGNYLPNLAWLVEDMDSGAQEDFWFVDDDIFEVQEGAGEALSKAMTKWAKKYLKPKVWRMGDSFVRVPLEPEKKK